jgi:hypothetical protein
VSIPPPAKVTWKPNRKIVVAGMTAVLAIVGGLVTLYGATLPPWLLIVVGPALPVAAGYLKSE